MKVLLQIILAVLARLTLRRYHPRIIGITGNVGKTSTKQAIYAVLSSAHNVRAGEKSYNNELGVPLTVLGIPHGGKNPFLWLYLIVGACFRLIWTRYPDILVLELGVDKPGDMGYLLSVVRPDIGVFTAIGEIPVHVENFASRDQLIQEKLKLARALPPEGRLIVNAEVPAWAEARKNSKTPVFTYGFSAGSDVRIGTPEYRFSEAGGVKKPIGIVFKITYKGSTVPFRLDNALHLESGAYIAAAACAVGLVMGMNLVEISSAIATRYIAPDGRLRLKEGIRGCIVLDDTYNASPSSTDAALSALQALPAKRKIAVLGDMLELGTYSEEAHRAIGKKASEVCDILVTVGTRMRFASAEAKAVGFKEGDRLFSFDTSVEAGKALSELVQEGDLVLAKGSRGMRMESAIDEIT